MSTFKHFVIIKFNYPENYKHLNTQKQMLKWISLESLRRQTNKDFHLVLISDMPLSTEGFGEYSITSDWKRIVRETGKKYDYVITTRLDSDDFVTEDFIQTIQENFEPKEKVIQTDGWIYDAREDKLIENWMFKKYTTSHISLIEPSDNIKTIYHLPHTKIKNNYEIDWVDKKCTIRCINEGSIKGSQRRIGFFSEKGKIVDYSNFSEWMIKCFERSRNLSNKIGN